MLCCATKAVEKVEGAGPTEDRLGRGRGLSNLQGAGGGHP